MAIKTHSKLASFLTKLFLNLFKDVAHRLCFRANFVNIMVYLIFDRDFVPRIRDEYALDPLCLTCLLTTIRPYHSEAARTRESGQLTQMILVYRQVLAHKCIILGHQIGV